MKIIELSDGGVLHYDETWLRHELADKLFQTLKETVPWKQERGSYAPFPRLTAYYADVPYTYSGVTHQAQEWLDVLRVVREKVEAVAGGKFNSLLLNYYRDGKDSIGWHTDAEPELGQNPIVPSISLGAVRTFCLRHKKGKKDGYLEIPLSHGSLLIMAGTTQHFWMHSVPKTDNELGERINLTFRNILA